MPRLAASHRNINNCLEVSTQNKLRMKSNHSNSDDGIAEMANVAEYVRRLVLQWPDAYQCVKRRAMTELHCENI